MGHRYAIDFEDMLYRICPFGPIQLPEAYIGKFTAGG